MPSDDPKPNQEPSPQSEAIRSARRRARELQRTDGEGSLKPLEAGDVIGGRFRLDRQVGVGGMGVVWSARDKTLDEAVALKFLPGQIARDPLAVEELRREAKTMRGLTHPNIVRLHDIRFAEGRAFLVQAFMAGGSLADFLASIPEGNLSLEETVWALREIAAALSHAHAQGITHRDIKPANLLLSKNPGDYLGGGGESLRVADFGLAFTAREAASRTSGYSPSGTLAFMAPEILMGKRPTPAADVYSLAATAYCLLEGRPPFHKGDIATQVVHAEAPKIDSGRPSLDQAIAAGLSKDPADRPATIEEFMGYVEGSVRMPRAMSSSSKTNLFLGLGLAAGVLGIVGFFTRDRWLGDSPRVLADGGGVEEQVSDGDPGRPAELAAETGKARTEEPVTTKEELGQESGASKKAAERAPVPPKPAAEPQPSPLEVHVAEIGKATSFEGVEAAFLAALEAGLGEECATLCEAMTAPLVEVYTQAPGGLEEGLARLAKLEGLRAQTDCEGDASWKKLGALALSIAPIEAAISTAGFEELLEARTALMAAGADEPDGLMAKELQAVITANTQALAGKLQSASEGESLEFLKLLPRLEAPAAKFPSDLLMECRTKIAAIEAGVSRERDLEALHALSAYIDGSGAAHSQAKAALDRVCTALLNRCLDDMEGVKKNDRVAYLYKSLDALEEELARAGHPTLREAESFAKRVSSQLTTKSNRRDLVGMGYEFAGRHPSTGLHPVLVLVADEAIAGLLDEMPKQLVGGFNQRHFERIFHVVQVASELEEGMEFLGLGQPGGLPSVHAEALAKAVVHIDWLVSESRRPRTGKGMTQKGVANALKDMEVALSKTPAMWDHYLEVLPVSAKAQFEFAMAATLKYRTNDKISEDKPTKNELEDFCETSKAWVKAARQDGGDRGELARAYDSLVKSYYHLGHINYQYAVRNYKAKARKQGNAYNPPEEKHDAIEYCETAQEYLREYGEVDSQAAIASGWDGKLKRLRADLNALKRQL